MLKWCLSSICIGAAALATAPFARAATVPEVTFQDGATSNLWTGEYHGTQDTVLKGGASFYRTYSRGSDTLIGPTGGDNTSDNEIQRALLKFDVSALAGKGTVQSATLQLTEYPTTSGASTITVNVYQITDANAGWQQGVSGSKVVGAATWDYLNYDTASWAGSAGLSTSTQNASDLNADYVVDENGNGVAQFSYANKAPDDYYKIINVDLPASLIQHWIDHPNKNAGLLFTVDTLSNDDYARFYTSEYSKQSYRPALVVQYVPEPATGAMLLGGMGLLVLRRRKS